MPTSSLLLGYALLLGGLLACTTNRATSRSFTGSADDSPDFLWTVAYAPAGKQYATGGRAGLHLVDDTGSIQTIPVAGTITELDWHPDGTHLAVSVQNGERSFIYDLGAATKHPLTGLEATGARAIGWNSEGDTLAVGDYGGVVSFYDDRAHFLFRDTVVRKGIIGLDWHPVGGELVLVGEDITLYDVRRRIGTTIQDREADILMLCVAYHPSGNFFVTGDYGDPDRNDPPLLQYWNRDGTKRTTFNKAIDGEYRSIEWSHDGKYLLTASDRVRIFDASGKLTRESRTDTGYLWGASWRDDDGRLLVTDTRGWVLAFDRRARPAAF